MIRVIYPVSQRIYSQTHDSLFFLYQRSFVWLVSSQFISCIRPNVLLIFDRLSIGELIISVIRASNITLTSRRHFLYYYSCVFSDSSKLELFAIIIVFLMITDLYISLYHAFLQPHLISVAPLLEPHNYSLPLPDSAEQLISTNSVR